MDDSTAISVFEKLDEQQIARADQAVKEKMVYEATINGQKKKEITYAGIKHIVLEMSAKGYCSLEILESTCNLDKDDPEDKTTWHWRAYYKCKNKITGQEEDGRAECSYIGEKYPYKDIYDPMAQRKAHSKAERNAKRKQIPELQIIEFLKAVKKEDIHQVNENEEFCTCEGGPKTQMNGKCRDCRRFSKTWYEAHMK